MNSPKRTLLVFKVDNVIDIITNSSSELFVLKGETKEIVEEMISNVYPDYKIEYDDVKHISELSIDDLDNFMIYECSPHHWPAQKGDMPIPGYFTFDDLYEPEKDNDGNVKPAWNGAIQYKLKNNIPEKDRKYRWHRSFVTEENLGWVLNKLDPERQMYFLYSKDENPNWEMQEALMNVGERYHLG